MQEEINKNKDITANSEQLNALKAQFPSCFDKDGRFRPDKLEDIVRASGADITREGYKLDWLGKSYARLLANLKTETLLAPNAAHNALPENASSENLLIQGDNLDVLKHLVNAYYKKVKMIYIDPPYNTGSDGFVYNDTRKFTVEELQRLAGVEEDEAKRILDFTQSSSNSHSAWLTFMYPRLYVARELLREDGVIFISIDDNEQAQLKLLCDEMFGAENFLGNIIWKNVTDNNPTNVATEHEYVMVYANSKSDLEPVWKSTISAAKELLLEVGANLIEQHDEQDALQQAYSSWFKENKSQLGPLDRYKYIDFGGVYTGSQSVHNPGKEGYRYDIIHPNTELPCKAPLMGYRFPEETMNDMIERGLILFGDDEEKLVEIKVYAKDYKQKLSSLFALDGRTGANELRELFPDDGKVFTNPKTIQLISDLVSFGTEDGDLVLDFFSGSGSTAHSIFFVNAIMNGKRTSVSVQLNEQTDEKSGARKAGYNTIFEVTRERIKRAATKIKKDYPEATCDFGFKEFKTIPANEGQFQGYLDDAATREDYEPFNGMALDNDGIQALLTTWAAYDGLPLHQTLQEVDLDGYTAYMGGDKLYFVNSGLGIKHIAAMLTRIDDDATFTPRKIVVFHYRFNDKQLREFSEAVNAPNRKHLQLDFIQRF